MSKRIRRIKRGKQHMLKFPALKINQNGKNIYTFKVLGKDILNFSSIDRAKRNENGKLFGYQRVKIIKHIKEIEKYGPEQLISLVAHGDIDYAVCDESIARAVADSLSQIDINTAISFTQFYSWAVSKQSPALLDSLNTWLDKFQKEKEYQKIYKK